MTRSESGERAVRWLLERRPLVLAIFGVLVLAAAFSVGRTVVAHGRLPVDNDLHIWFLDDDPVLLRYQAFLERWGNDEAVVVGLFDPQGVLRAPTLDLLARLSERLAELEGVEGVTSLSTVVPVSTDDEGDLVLERHYRAPVDPAQVDRIGARIRGDPLYTHHLLSEDGTATILSVQVERGPGFDAQRKAVLARVRAALRETLREDGRDPDGWAWGGIGVIYVALNQLVLRDSARLMGFTLLLLALGLGVAFRRVLAVMACLLSVGAATLLLIGTYLACGLTLNMVTMVLPSLVLVVGLTDAVYFLMTYQTQRRLEPELEVRQAVVRALGFCFWPGLFNSVTTAVGFLAFLSAKMQVVRHLGVFAGVGIAFAFLASLIVCSFLIDAFPQRFTLPARAAASPGRLLGALAGVVIRRRRLILAGTAVACLLAAAGLSRLRVDSYSLGYFYDDHEIKRHDRALLDAVGPYIPLELVLRTDGPDGARRPEVLAAMERIVEETIAAEPTVSRAISLAAVTRRLNQVFGDDPQAALPDDPAVIDQLLLFYDPERPDDPVRLVDTDWQTTRFSLRVKNDGARAARELLERIHARTAGKLPPGVTLESGGYMPLYTKLIDHLVWGQVTSIAITAVVVFCLIALLFRSLRYALISLLPNLLPVALTLALVGALGISLDVATVLIAAIALGVAVDDTIHFLFKFRAALADHGDPQAAVRTTLTTTGRAIASTSLIVTAGFAVLGLANIKTIALFGLLLGATMLTALAAELLVTPALVLTFPPPSRPDGHAAPPAEAPDPPPSPEAAP